MELADFVADFVADFTLLDFVDFAVLDFLETLLAFESLVTFALFTLESLLETLESFFVAFVLFNTSFIATSSFLSKYKIRPQCGQVVMASALIKSTKILSLIRIKHPLHACFLIGTMLVSFAHLRIFS